MKKIIALTAIIFAALALAKIATPPAAKPAELTNIKWKDYVHPDGEEIQIVTSIDTSTETRADRYKRMSRRELLVGLGEALFHKPTGVRGTSCADCHSKKNAGTGFTLRAEGGGEFHSIMNEYYEEATGEKSLVEPDKKPFKNRSILNSYKLLEQNRILAQGKQGDTIGTLERQVQIATEIAHFSSDLIEECKSDIFMNSIANAITGKKLDAQFVRAAISAWEQTQTTSNNNINRAYRNPEKHEILSPEGLKLIQEKECMSCHANGLMAASRAPNKILDTVLTPRLDLNLKDHKGYMHNAQIPTLYKAIKACDMATSKEQGKEPYNMLEIYQIRRFINQNLYDTNYTEI